MVRAYCPEPVDEAALERILEAARRAPSAGNTQGQAYVVLTEASDRRAVADACGEPAYTAKGFAPWLSQAPVQVLVCAEPQTYHARYAEADKAASRKPADWPVPYWYVDAGAGLMLLLLAAVDEGLAAGFCDVGDRPALHARFGIPDEVVIVGVVTLGHAAEKQRRSGSLQRGRREGVVHRDRW